jgi:hypothetical protein
MPRRTAKAAPKASKHEHWAKKSAIVAIIASVITFLGGLNLLIYSAGHITPLRLGLTTAPFWIAVVTLFIIAVLVDYAANNLKKVCWIEDVVGAVFGALGYLAFFGALGVLAFATISGFIVGAIILFVLFYLGFQVGHTVDFTLKQSGIDIN